MTAALAPYRDPSLTPEARACDLLGRMTRPEKLAQLGSIWAFEVCDDDGPDPGRLRDAARDGLGQLTRLAGSTNLRPAQVARAANEIQRFLIEETRLGIPAIIHEESLHGLIAWGAPCFQQSIGAAATFDPEVVARVATTIRRRMLLTSARQALGPVFDLCRDPRWGRVEETYGEDPYLAAVIGTAYVRALQGPDLRDGVLATAKHMVGHGLAEGGLNMAPAHVGPRELADEQLFPFEAAVRDAGVGSVMPAYSDVDGVPSHASRELLTTILRDRWGFDGIVVADYTGIAMLHSLHRMTEDLASAGAVALQAGVDVELPMTAAYGDLLGQAIDDGLVTDDDLDRAVERVLRMKIRLGLFERPYVEPLDDAALAALVADEAVAGSELARRSIVLVRNEGILPLEPAVRRIAVIGPAADSARELLGDYSHLVHMETLHEMRSRGNAFGIVSEGKAADPVDELAGMTTILGSLRARFRDAEVRYHEGTGIHDGTDADITEAAAIATDAEVAVVVLGERSGLTDDATTGEFRDRRELGFHGRQQELLEAVVGTGTPVVLVVVSGRPLAMEWAAEHCAAIVLAWVPGEAGPRAIAEVLAGDVDPGGRLPISMPRHVGQVPITYRHHPSGGRSQWKGDYVDGRTGPLWPFGFGLSYTRFAFERMRIDQPSVPTQRGTLRVAVDVRNVGSRVGDEVVQLYARDVAASIARPIRELRGFARVTLDPGACRTVTFTLQAEQFAFTGLDLHPIIEPGTILLEAGSSSADLPVTAEFRLTGPTVAVTDRRHYVTETAIE